MFRSKIILLLFASLGYDLPNNSAQNDDLYQFCYISGENVVQGISTPFQIYSFNSPPPSRALTDSTYEHKKCTHLKQLLIDKDQEILKLKEENAILKESLKAIVEQKMTTQKHKCHSEDVDELKELTSKLKNAILGQQKDIDSMKMEMRKERAFNKNLMLDKIMAEKKFEAIFNKNEATSIKRLPNFDLSNLQSIPAFPFDNIK